MEANKINRWSNWHNLATVLFVFGLSAFIVVIFIFEELRYVDVKQSLCEKHKGKYYGGLEYTPDMCEIIEGDKITETYTYTKRNGEWKLTK